MARHPHWVRSFLSNADLDAIAAAVARQEARSSGELRVHLDRRCPGDAQARAVEVFGRLGMVRTARRNGVLIYVAVEDRKLAVIGDEGVHARVGDPYWVRLVERVGADLGGGRPGEGLIAAVDEVGEMLAQHFPREWDDRNELGDTVSLGPD
jgi:uncharacterized membrane protein